MNYEVIKALNNNVVLAKHNKQEIILIGKGIGFGKKEGDSIDGDLNIIEKIFRKHSTKGSFSYLEEMPEFYEEVVEICGGLITKAQSLLGPLSPNIHNALVDHISFTLNRIYMGLPIENPFIDEISLLYEKEYDIAGMGASLLEDRLGVEIGDDERGFIALHIYSARTNKSIGEAMKDTRLFKEIITIISEEIGGPIEYKDYGCQSFIRSIKAVLEHARLKGFMHNPLIDDIKNKLVKSYRIAEKINKIIEEEKDVRLSQEMVAYLAVDIEKMRQYWEYGHSFSS